MPSQPTCLIQCSGELAELIQEMADKRGVTIEQLFVGAFAPLLAEHLGGKLPEVAAKADHLAQARRLLGGLEQIDSPIEPGDRPA